MIDIISPSKAAIIYNTQKKSIETLYKELGCSHLINGGFFISDTKRSDYFDPTMWLVLGGNVISKHIENGVTINDWGLAIESGLPVMSTDRGGDYLSLIPLLKNGQKLQRNLKPDVARKAERSAIGWTKDGKLILAVTDAVVRETLQNYMISYGAVDALMCDGGGSAQGIFPNGKVVTGRKVPTLIAVWTSESAKSEPKAVNSMLPWDKVVELAKSQIGVKESPKNSNRQKYGEWYGANGTKWCVEFVEWVFNFANNPLPYKTASCSALRAWYEANDPSKIFNYPLPGDIVLYDFGHCGIVTDVGASTIKAVEGNTSSTIIGSQDNGGGVYQRSRPRKQVLCYIRPYKEASSVNITLNVLRRGSRGEEVKTLQRLLNALGYKCGSVDGDFGSGTEKAVKKYQQAYSKSKGLAVDGVVGQATWNALLGV